MANAHRSDALPAKGYFALESLLEDHRILWVIALLALVFFSITNLPWQLDDYSQERQALASFDHRCC